MATTLSFDDFEPTWYSHTYKRQYYLFLPERELRVERCSVSDPKKEIQIILEQEEDYKF